jgi:hypothetical protein
MAKFICVLTILLLSTFNNTLYAATSRLDVVVNKQIENSGFISLNNLVADQHKSVDLEDVTIDHIIVKAKSKEVPGQISLIIGKFESSPLRVPPNPDFVGTDPSTFYSIKLQAPVVAGLTKDLSLKVRTNGNIKINGISIFVSPKNNQSINRFVNYTTIGKFRVEKFFETQKTIQVNNIAKTIRLIPLDNEVQILEARVLLNNGEEIYLDRLVQRIDKGRSLTQVLNGRFGVRVRSVTIRAVSPNLFGTRTDLEVQAGN